VDFLLPGWQEFLDPFGMLDFAGVTDYSDQTITPSHLTLIRYGTELPMPEDRTGRTVSACGAPTS